MLVSVSLTGGTADIFDGAVEVSSPLELDRLAFYEVGKRSFDVFVASLLIIVLGPLLLIVALLIKSTSSGPIIFKQQRLTLNRKVFTLYKFRTMYADAESATGAVWASANDPRITPIGNFLRMTRLDEIPQLINVLSGDMSLIGPRPERPEIAEELLKEFPSFYKRNSVKAGITGLAQVSHGYADSVESYKKKLDLDLTYIEQRSLILDFKIALKTILVVLTGSGAQ